MHPWKLSTFFVSIFGPISLAIRGTWIKSCVWWHLSRNAHLVRKYHWNIKNSLIDWTIQVLLFRFDCIQHTYTQNVYVNIGLPWFIFLVCWIRNLPELLIYMYVYCIYCIKICFIWYICFIASKINGTPKGVKLSYGQVNSLQIKLSVAWKWESKHLWGYHLFCWRWYLCK